VLSLAYQLPVETSKSAIARHEYFLAGRLGVKKGSRVLDCGCGIGGPMRNIARFTRAKITGVTLNEVPFTPFSSSTLLSTFSTHPAHFLNNFSIK
jgi:2-polyprenyl-3-methyl-5-hydroxy-6-metoxy-1,4-benzoquinol methylase